MIKRGHDPLYWAKEFELHEVVKELSKVCFQQCELYLDVACTVDFYPSPTRSVCEDTLVIPSTCICGRDIVIALLVRVSVCL